MEKQVLSIEQMRELIELGIDTSKASMCYCDLESDEYHFGSNVIVPNNATLSEYGLCRENLTPTFTLQDILEILPNWIDPYYYNVKYHKNLFYHEYVNKWICSYVASNGASIQQFASDSPLEAAFNMLKWCKHNKYI